uniref:Prostate and testis expressed 1 n=1 Tax=Callithrix jacchus TaxID=9483 RepID=A0A8I3VXI4_CALJA
MDRSILLELPILLFCFRALSGSLLQRKAAVNEEVVVEDNYPVIEIAQCSMWHFQFSGEVCSRRRGTASMEECCMFGFGRNGTPLLIVMGCQKNCADVKGIRWSVYFVNFRGCRGYDLCNEDF